VRVWHSVRKFRWKLFWGDFWLDCASIFFLILTCLDNSAYKKWYTNFFDGRTSCEKNKPLLVQGRHPVRKFRWKLFWGDYWLDLERTFWLILTHIDNLAYKKWFTNFFDGHTSCEGNKPLLVRGRHPVRKFCWKMFASDFWLDFTSIFRFIRTYIDNIAHKKCFTDFFDGRTSCAEYQLSLVRTRHPVREICWKLLVSSDSWLHFPSVFWFILTYVENIAY
jgi:hypothetical protein